MDSSNNNNNNNMSSDEEGGPYKKNIPKNWPQQKVLWREHQDVVFKLLRAVDECKCTSELHANNSDNPKGNKWNRLFDHCFGGGSEGRGLLAGHVSTLASASKLKIKVLDIWTYAKKNNDDDQQGIVDIAMRQYKEYEKTKAIDETARSKQKQNMEELVDKMQTYEGGMGALPPSAKGTVGAGRRQHSTNLKTNEPGTYAYANLTTGGDNDKIIVVEDHTPPKGKGKSKPKPKPQASAAVVHEKTTLGT
jgi:hypothetical protein